MYEDLPKIMGYPGASTEPALRCSQVRTLTTEFKILTGEQGKGLAKETIEFIAKNFDLFFDDRV